MALVKANIPMPALTRLAAAGSSKYDFANLQEGECYLETTEVVDVAKVSGRLTSAVASYRARTKDTRKFTVRSFTQADGTKAVGVWVVPAAPAAAPVEAA